jgi:hypothetical protein
MRWNTYQDCGKEQTQVDYIWPVPDRVDKYSTK